MDFNLLTSLGASRLVSLLRRGASAGFVDKLVGGVESRPSTDNKLTFSENGVAALRGEEQSSAAQGFSSRRERRREAWRQRKAARRLLYVDTDDDFRTGEVVGCTVVGLRKTKKHHLQYVMADTDDGRHTRIHVRSFDLSGQRGISPDALQPGDRLTLRKTGYTPRFQNTCWVVESAPLSALLRQDRTAGLEPHDDS